LRDAHQATIHRPHNLPPEALTKRKHPVAIPMRIVSAKTSKPTAPADDAAVTEGKPAQLATIAGPRIVTARKPRGRFADVPETQPEEHQQRGDAAEALSGN
jgi:hypothetical protein